MDQLEKIKGGIIHHGKWSDRIYVLDLPENNVEDFLSEIEGLAQRNKYGKIVIKAPEVMKENLVEKGYVIEAKVPGFYQGTIMGGFFCKYLDKHRELIKDQEIVKSVLDNTKMKWGSIYLPITEGVYTFKIVGPESVEDMSHLYQQVFDTYPFPIHKAEYIQQTMEENVIYFGIWNGEELVGLSSAEVSEKCKNAEMTDFAIMEGHRGKNLSLVLLVMMEMEMKKIGIPLVYTIARAISYGMNDTFSKNGYTYAGTLKNNTQICGSIESMNVWYKKI